MKNYMLILLIAIPFYAQQPNKLYVAGKPEFAPDILLNRDIKDANYEVCAGLMILTDLTGLAFDSYNGIVKLLNDQPGQYLLFLSESERVVEVFKTGYTPLKMYLPDLGIRLQKGVSWKVTVTGDKILKDEVINVSILIEPADAILSIDGVIKSGTAHGITPGKHSISITKEGYTSIIEEINVTAENIRFDFKLKAIEPVALRITSEPAGARISIDGMEKGITPKSFFYYPGKYTLKLTLPEYVDKDEQIEITEGSKNEINFKMLKNTGILNLTIEPNDTEVLLDGIPAAGRQLELKPGKYSLKLSRKNYFSIDENIEMILGETLNKEYKLVKNTGILKLSIIPSDAELYINNDNTNKSQMLELPPGIYKVEIKKDDYYPISEIVEIKLNETIERNYELKAKTGILQLTVNPDEAEVKLLSGGKEIKSWTGLGYIKDILTGNYEIVIKKDGYKTYKKQVIINENKTTIEDITLEKGSDAPPAPAGMVYVEGGTFQMGSAEGESDEKPVHSVTISSFYIGKYEVTQKEWKEIMGSNPSEFKGDNLPVEQVSWNDVQEYIRKLNAKTGEKYRLPTEAEWEYAARGGASTGSGSPSKYSGSDNIEEVAWYSGNSGSKTHNAGTKAPNELVIYDMSGNLWEWCSDWYGKTYYSSSPSKDPKGPASGEYRVLRGGSWLSHGNGCRSANRLWAYPDNRHLNNGFRLARDL